MTSLIIALVAAATLLTVGVILHNRIITAIKAVHARLTAIENAVTGDVKA